MKLFVNALMMLLVLGLSAQAQQKGSVLVKNATVITVSGEDLSETDVLVQNGIITRIGKNLTAPKGVEEIDATGKFLMPGILDAHSHLAITRGINEATAPVTAQVTMEDVINPNDFRMYAALAGGVTTIHVMHGSANVIGGQGETIKLRYGADQEGLKFKEAPRTIKFALGENPTRVHGQGNNITPRSRMGVEQVIRTTFDAALDYRKARNEYLAAVSDKKRRGPAPVPVAKHEQYEVIADIIEGKILVHCHSYRADEIHMLMRVFRDYGVKNYTFQHANEAFKVAPELVKNGAMTSIFADWWAYKFEVYYSTAYNASILNANGVVNSINSDSEELIRHLNHEAAKVVKYGGTSKADAIKMITLNPAKQLGVDKFVGSIEVGKHADFALWSKHPLSIYAICERTFVDGVTYFNRATDPDDMRLVINPSDEYEVYSKTGRMYDACMADVFYFFGEEAQDAHHGHQH